MHKDNQLKPQDNFNKLILISQLLRKATSILPRIPMFKVVKPLRLNINDVSSLELEYTEGRTVHDILGDPTIPRSTRIALFDDYINKKDNFMSLISHLFPQASFFEKMGEPNSKIFEYNINGVLYSIPFVYVALGGNLNNLSSRLSIKPNNFVVGAEFTSIENFNITWIDPD